MRVCLGGTFDRFHRGHEALLERAFEVGREAFVGVTSDRLGQKGRARRVRPFADRKRDVESFLHRRGWKATVSEIDHPFGRSVEPVFDAIVVSPETAHRTRAINAARRRRRLKPLQVFTIPFHYGDDGLRITATRMAEGLIDGQGRRLRPLRVAAGTTNRVKVSAVRDAFRTAFPRVRVVVRGVAVPSGVPEQPRGAQTVRGGRMRAQRALEAWKGAEYGVGVEAGLVRDSAMPREKDVQYAVIVDCDGVETVGHGGGFYYPGPVTRAVRAGKTVSEVLGPMAGDPRIGSTQGAVGFLTRGALDRRELTRHGVLLALVPRIRRDLYQE